MATKYMKMCGCGALILFGLQLLYWKVLPDPSDQQSYAHWMPIQVMQTSMNTQSWKVIANNERIKRSKRPLARNFCKNAAIPLAFTREINQEHLLHIKNRGLYHDCCYRQIERSKTVHEGVYNSDWLVKTSDECTPVSRNGIKITTSVIRYECKKNTSALKEPLIHTDFLATVLPPRQHSSGTLAKATHWNRLRTETESLEFPPNVLMIGIDGLSRFQMQKSLPKSWSYAVENDFIEFKGFTATHGSYTFGNMMAMLTGRLEEEYSCWDGVTFHLDKCGFIWKKYNSLQYITALVEDSTHLSMFNYNKKGFVEQPVDYMLRTLLVASEKYLNEIKSDERRGVPVNTCINGKSNVDTMLTYIREFVENVGRKYPYFLVSLFRTLEQDDDTDAFNAVQRDDDSLVGMLKSILRNDGDGFNSSNSPSVDNTVIIVYSTHGHGSNSYEIFKEEAKPALLIRIPPNLKNAHPKWYQNMRINSERLTSSPDIHSTLGDVSMLSYKSVQYSNIHFFQRMRRSKSHAYSLFQEIPINRTCEAARIPRRYCNYGTNRSVLNGDDDYKVSTKASNIWETADIGYMLMMSNNLTTYRNWAVAKTKELVKQELISYNLPIHDGFVVILVTILRKHLMLSNVPLVWDFLDTLDKYILKKGGQPIRTLICTKWRSGSTFLGEIFRSHAATFYNFEPLVVLNKLSSSLDEVRQTFLARLLDCKFNDLGPEYMERAKTMNWILSNNARLYSFCELHPEVCWDENFLKQMCSLFPFQVTKTVRLSLKRVQPLLEDPKLNLRIIYLLRDPRGTMLSRLSLKWCKNSNCGKTDLLCSELVEDYYEAQKLRNMFPDQFLVIRYEDMATNIYSAVQKMFEFSRMEYHPTVKSFLDDHTEFSFGGPQSTFRSSKSTPFHWIRDVVHNFTVIENIQRSCKEAMNLWGYKIAHSSNELLSDFNPIMKPPWPEMLIQSDSSHSNQSGSFK